jgi:hypothetical protein
VDKKVEETLKVLTLKAIEQGMEKIAGIFDKYTVKIGQEIDSINQKIMNLESRIDRLEKSVSPLGLSPVASQTPTKTTISSELASSSSYSPAIPTRQPAKRNLEPASFASGEDTTMRKPQREVFREYRPARGGIVEEKHVKVAVFSKELDRRKEAASATPPEGRTVVISHIVRDDMAASEPISRPSYTPQEDASETKTAPENKVEIEEWLRKTENSFNEMPSETRREVMPHYTRLKLYLCKDKSQKDSACARCLIQNTIDCPLYSPAPKRKTETYITY